MCPAKNKFKKFWLHNKPSTSSGFISMDSSNHVSKNILKKKFYLAGRGGSNL
jgi:hypothetical protein